LKYICCVHSLCCRTLRNTFKRVYLEKTVVGLRAVKPLDILEENMRRWLFRGLQQRQEMQEAGSSRILLVHLVPNPAERLARWAAKKRALHTSRVGMWHQVARINRNVIEGRTVTTLALTATSRQVGRPRTNLAATW